MGSLKHKIICLSIAVLLLFSSVSNMIASHDATLPLTCENFYSSWVLRVNLCAFGREANWDSAKVQATLDAVVAGSELQLPLWISASWTPANLIRPLGFYDAGSRTIFINGKATEQPPDYLFYYVLGHELMHAIYDRWHVNWDEQHCKMYKTNSELEPVRSLLRSWNPKASPENPFLVIAACAGK